MSQGPNVVYLMVFQPYLNINKGIVVGIAFCRRDIIVILLVATKEEFEYRH